MAVDNGNAYDLLYSLGSVHRPPFPVKHRVCSRAGALLHALRQVYRRDSRFLEFSRNFFALLKVSPAVYPFLSGISNKHREILAALLLYRGYYRERETHPVLEAAAESVNTARPPPGDGQPGTVEPRPAGSCSRYGHVWTPAAVGDRARWDGKDHRHASPRHRLDRERRHRRRPCPLRQCGRAAPHPTGPEAVADNLAKLAWAITHNEPLAGRIGADTLVIIDEAGMADTLTLDHLTTWCLDQGASVRLIGDDQQLGAIGAGGVLRDIATEHGALRLDEVVRFSDPAEADASLALRAGDSGAIGFYLDHHRVHVVDPDTAASRVLAAWRVDVAAGLDALMLAPTREQVAALNAAARTARLEGHRVSRHVQLPDGNQASAGDTVITRRNNRDLSDGDTAWVRNGDRWRVTAVRRDGAIDVQHLRNHNRLTLPAWYVTESVELGYATTIHAAQGITADTCHGLLTGEESRQQAYTLTRGRHANHAWLQIDSADTHVAPVDPGLLQPASATQLLEAVIGRDDAPASATTLLRQADQPDQLLGPAADVLSRRHHLCRRTPSVAGGQGLDRRSRCRPRTRSGRCLADPSQPPHADRSQRPQPCARSG